MKKHPQVIRKEKNIELIKELASTHTTKEISKKLNLTTGYLNIVCKEIGIKPLLHSYITISDIEHQVIIGSILGDGSISKHGITGHYSRPTKWYSNSCLIIKHSKKQEEYVNYKYNLLKNICPSKPRYAIRKETRPEFKTKFFEEVTIQTTKNKVFNKYRNNWYTEEGVKVLDKKEFSKITPLSMAIWFMDDGTNEGTGFSISTMCFKKEEVEYMKEVLLKKYNLYCTIRSNNSLYIKAKSSKDFINLINPYIINSMKYKTIVRKKSGEFRETPEVDNPEPSSSNDIKVDEKVQRLTVEESTNNTDTSAGQPGINGEPFTIWVKEDWFKQVDDIV